MSAKWSVQPVKGTVADADVFLIIDSEAGPTDNKQVLFSTLALAAQTPWRGDIDAATFNLDNLTSVDLNNALGTNPIISALQSASESTVVLGSNFQVSSGYIDIAEIVTPTNPAADVGRLYVKDDGGITTLFFRDSAGTETDLQGGASPLTTQGDIFGRDATGDQRFPIGSPGQQLTVNTAQPTNLQWVTPASRYTTVEDEGTPVAEETTINFVGAGVTATPGTGKTTVTIPGGGGGSLATLTDVDLTGQAIGGLLVNVDGTNWNDLPVGSETEVLTIVGGIPAWAASAAGEINLGANVGTGTGLIFRDKTGVTLNFKSLIAGANISLNNNADDIEIIASGSASPLTTQGDIFGRDGTGDQRIPIGFPGQVLTVQTAQPTQVNWVTPVVSPVSVIGHVSVGAPTNSISIVLSETINFDDTVTDIELVGSFSLAVADTVNYRINLLTQTAYSSTFVFVSNTGTVTGQNTANASVGWTTGKSFAAGLSAAVKLRLNIADSISLNSRPTGEIWETPGDTTGDLYRAGRVNYVATPAPTNIVSIQLVTNGGQNFEAGSSFTVIKRTTS
jgi:hypothetical protein